MHDEGTPEFDEVWNTLVRAGVARKLSTQATVTPNDYGREAGDELTLPAPLPQGELVVDHLPLFQVTEGEDGDLLLGEVLGTGGMGSVHVARQVALQRDVAIKRLHDPNAPTHVDALLREAVITGTLEHPNIVPVHMLGRDEDGHPVLVMKRIQGRLWSELLGRASLDRHLEILKDVCNALHYAHSRGVIHLDLKPQNVLIGEFGEVSLLDWGIARRMSDPAPGVMLGTPAYMASEMVGGETLTAQTDVYLLGATLHRVLTGTARHSGKNTHRVLRSAWKSEPVDYPPEVPGELADLCNRATSVDPALRPQSALAFRQAIEAYERHRSSALLAQVAASRLAGLRALVAETSPQPRRVREMAGITRFGLREALDQWADNQLARSALMDTLELMVRWEIDAGVADEAERHLAELAELGDEGEVRHAALADEVEDAVRKARALARLGRQMDMSVGSGFRVAFVLVIGGIGTLAGGTLLVAVRMGWAHLGHPLNVTLAAGGAAVFTVLLFLGRKHMLHTLANQRVWYMTLIGAWAFVLNRVLGWWMGLPVEEVMVHELLLGATTAGLLGVAVDLRLLFGLALLLAAAMGAAMFPAFALDISILAIACSGVIAVGSLWHWIR